MTAAIRLMPDTPRVFDAKLGAAGAAIGGIALDETAQQILLYSAAGAIVIQVLRRVFGALKKLADAGDHLEHLPEWMKQQEEQANATRELATAAQHAASSNENALHALLRELGIEARALRRHGPLRGDHFDEAIADARHRDRRRDPEDLPGDHTPL